MRIKDFKNFNTINIILIVLSMSIMSIIIVQNIKYSINSDGAACALQALEMHKRGTIFLTTFHESTYIHLHTYAIWIGLFFTENLQIASIIGSLISMVLLASCVLFFCKLVLAKTERIFVFVFLFSYISSSYVNFHFLANYYTQFFIGQFLTLSVFISSIDLDNNIITIKNKKRFSSFLILVVLFGLLGIRSMQYITLPLVAASFLINWNEKKLDNSVRFKDLSNILYIPIMIAIFGVIAYYMSLIYVEPLFNVSKDFSEMVVVKGMEQIFNHFLYYIKYLIGNMSIPYNYKILSLKGILAILKTATLVVLAFVFPILQFKRYPKLNKKERIVLLFAITNFVITSALLIMIDDSAINPDAYGRYLLNAIIFLEICGIQYFVYHIHTLSNVYKKVYTVLFMFIFISNSILSINVGSYKFESDIANYLSENNLKYGYANFWNAGINTYATNDNVKVRQISISNGSISPRLWLCDDSWYGVEAHEGQSFLLLTSEQLESFCQGDFSSTIFGEPEQILNYEDYTIAIFDYNISKYFDR